MKQDDLNNFSQYSTYSTYKSRTQIDQLQNKSIRSDSAFQNKEINKLNERIDSCIDKMSNIFTNQVKIDKQENKEQQLIDNMETLKSFYNPKIKQKIEDSIYHPNAQQQNEQNKQIIDTDVQDYINFQMFVKAKRETLKNNKQLADMYKLYLKEDIQQKVIYYQQIISRQNNNNK